jgi:hypothetical protein
MVGAIHELPLPLFFGSIESSLKYLIFNLVRITSQKVSVALRKVAYRVGF